MKNTFTYIIILLLALSVETYPQFSNEHIGGYIGIGSIKGNSPSQSSLAGSIQFGFNHSLFNEIGVRFGYTYARKVNYFLPENSRGRYYPYLQTFSARAIIDQQLDRLVFVEEGLGLCAVNDRTFSDVDEWAYGIIFSVMLGWDIRNNNNEGYKLGFTGESTLTVTSTTPSYFLLAAQVQYYF